MVQQTIHQASSWSPPTREKSPSIASRPLAVQAQQNSPEPLAQRETENEDPNQSIERAARFGHNFANSPILPPATQMSAPVQAKQMTGDHSSSPTEQRPNHTGLPDHLKAGIENLSGLAMDDVRVHYHSPKPAQLQALAYTHGTDIHVALGQEQHLPHEAWHVVQQKQGRVKPTRQIEGNLINEDRGLEKEAKVMVAKALLAQPRDSSTLKVDAGHRQDVLQLVKVDIDDKEVEVNHDMTVEEIIRILGYTPGSKLYGGTFSKTIDAGAAKLIVEELELHTEAAGKLEGLIEDLQALAEDEETTDSGEDASGSEFIPPEEELHAHFAREDTSPREKKIADLMKAQRFGKEDAEKLVTAQEVQQLFAEWGRKVIYLSGGGAIALFAQQRAISDLDFRIHSEALEGESSWYQEAENEWVPGAHLNDLNQRVEGEKFTNVPKGARPNATNSRTVGVGNFAYSGVEVSITIVGQRRETEVDEPTGVNRLTKGQLLSDKLKTIISRNKIGDEYVGKVSKDIYDALAVYVSKYDTDKVEKDVVKSHLSERAAEYRTSNTDEDQALLDSLGIEQLVQRMFNRLIITVGKMLKGEEGNLRALAKDPGRIQSALNSLSRQELQPVWNGWFRIVKMNRRLKSVPVFDVSDFESLQKYEAEMANLIHVRIYSD